ncbi:hypothetical protein MJO28_003925 [Puccinia striiformis f. sp. tritici]|uniref:Uncharacterized protein n=1 Tax=Puccinia striiformis f. sp. tritici TaxID=168172 RepID=A0ACC0EP04_9BASI|nr:hypothetical protein MJO28_003925 [Puccinia striiformis f. sp. tritici]
MTYRTTTPHTRQDRSSNDVPLKVLYTVHQGSIYRENIGESECAGHPGDIGSLLEEGSVGNLEFAVGTAGTFVGSILDADLDSYRSIK